MLGMPSKRKRIGYLPTQKIQELITQISKNENLSQSKVVGILVEEALKARGLFDYQISNPSDSAQWYGNKQSIDNSFLNHNDMDELISDNGISYKNEFDKELFEQYKQFLHFQKILKEKK